MISALPTRRRLLFGGVGVGLALLVTYLVFGGAAAVRLQAVVPADGAAVTASPAEVALRFTAAPRPRAVHMTVVGPAGQDVTRGGPVVDGALISVAVAADRPGRYRVGYHVELGDGTAASGVATFTVGDGAGPAGEPAEGAHGGHHLERDVSTLVLVLIDLALVAGLVLVLVRRPRVR